MTPRRTRPGLLSRLGPGLVTGAADDDPSGIATYSQAGAQFGYGVLWTVVVTTPLMVAIQLVSARIGRVTGQGIVANLRGRHPPALLACVLGLLIVANTINIAATLHAAGITSIQTSAQAAEALRPLAGEFTFLLFAFGVIGTGMLAVPVLAGSAAYALSEAFGWPATLEAKPSAAPRFYAIITAAMLAAVAIDFTPLDPIQMLFWSAVINGVVAAPIMAVMLVLACDPQVMGAFVLPRGLRIAGWAATALMALVVLALVGAALLRGGAP